MLSDLFYRMRSIFRRGSMESELNDEIRFHIEQETEKLIRRGMAPREAERQARLAFGFRDLVKEQCRDERGTGWVESLGRDVAFAARLLRTNASFTAVALLSLGMGIGANTAIFQLLDAVRLRDLPVKAPHELYEVVIGGEGPSGNFTSRYSRLSYAQWEQIEAQQQAYSSIGVWSVRRFNLASGGEIRPAEGILVSGRFFETLGVQAARGRVLGPGDDRPGCGAPAAVISDAFWKREFGGAEDAVGRSLKIDGHAATVVGITPASFFGVEVGRSYDLAIPLCAETQLNGADSQLTARRDTYWLSAIGRMRGGWTERRADAHLRTISQTVFAASLPAGMSAERTTHYREMWLRAEPAGKGLSWLRVNYEKALWLLFGSAALVLLVACGNLANLLLARASARTHEMAVRVALGASRGRLVRQLVTESLLLALMGAALGLLLAGAVSQSLVAFLVTADDPVALRMGMDWRVLSFSMGMGLCTCLLFGLAPAVWASRVEPSSAFAGARRGSASRGRSAFRSFLVAAQVALSLVLVAGAMLFGRSLFKLLGADTGFHSEHVLVTSLDTRRLGFNEERQRMLFDTLLARLRATPGVIQAAQSTIIPMSGWESNTSLVRSDGQSMRTRFSPVSSGYFATLGTPLLGGRDFGEEDNQTGPAGGHRQRSVCAQILCRLGCVGADLRVAVWGEEDLPDCGRGQEHEIRHAAGGFHGDRVLPGKSGVLRAELRAVCGPVADAGRGIDASDSGGGWCGEPGDRYRVCEVGPATARLGGAGAAAGGAGGRLRLAGGIPVSGGIVRRAFLLGSDAPERDRHTDGPGRGSRERDAAGIGGGRRAARSGYGGGYTGDAGGRTCGGEFDAVWAEGVRSVDFGGGGGGAGPGWTGVELHACTIRGTAGSFDGFTPGVGARVRRGLG